MALNIVSLNVRGLRDSSKCARLLGELKNMSQKFCNILVGHASLPKYKGESKVFQYFSKTC